MSPRRIGNPSVGTRLHSIRERPILFSAPMVRALLEGTKTQTRRIAKEFAGKDGLDTILKRFPHQNGCPYGVPGDRLWVKHAADVFPVYLKPVEGWEGLYAAGTDGAIYRMDRGAPEPLTPSPNSKGYSTVSLSRGKWETHAVHRLICEAFYGLAPALDAQVRHLDGDRSNSRPVNLDWGTPADNWQDRKGHGGGMGEQHHAAKLSEAVIAEIRTSSLSQRALARKFGVSQATVSDARSGKTWAKHATGERNLPEFSLWRSPIFMPRWAARITLEITEARVERLQDISEADSRAEGITDGGCTNCGEPEPCGCTAPAPSARDAYCHLWGQISGPDSWGSNPFVSARCQSCTSRSCTRSRARPTPMTVRRRCSSRRRPGRARRCRR